MTVCFECGARYSHKDVASAAVYASLIWASGLYAIVLLFGFVFALVLVGLKIEDETAGFIWFGIIFAMSAVFSVWVLGSLLRIFGPYSLYNCGTCGGKNPVPVYQCRRCGKMTAVDSLLHHVAGILWASLFTVGVFFLLLQEVGDLSCSLSLIFGAIFSIVFIFDTFRYLEAGRWTQEELDLGHFPQRSYREAHIEDYSQDYEDDEYDREYRNENQDRDPW